MPELKRSHEFLFFELKKPLNLWPYVLLGTAIAAFGVLVFQLTRINAADPKDIFFQVNDFAEQEELHEYIKTWMTNASMSGLERPTTCEAIYNGSFNVQELINMTDMEKEIENEQSKTRFLTDLAQLYIQVQQK